MSGKGIICAMVILVVCLISISAAGAVEDSANDLNDSVISQESVDLDVSASDDENSNENADDVISSGDEFALSQSDEDVVGANIKPFEELWLDKLKNGGEASLDCDYRYADNIDSEYIDSQSGGLKLTKNLILHGNGRTIDGNNQVVPFVLYNCELTIDNLNIINGKADKDGVGGAIYLYNSKLTAVNCNFINNHAKEAGGAILVSSFSFLNLTGCNFNDNVAESGGAISIAGITGLLRDSISDCTFNNNQANSGGAIAVFKGNNFYSKVDLKITDSRFNNNHANGVKGSGGAIYASETNVNIANSNFTDNTAEDVGGAITALDCVQLYATSSIFTNNAVNGSASCGGVVYAQGCQYLTLSFSNFTDNSAYSAGGVVYAVDITRYVNMDYSNFTNNHAIEGGAVEVWNSKMVYVSNSNFYNNNATGLIGQGGAIRCRNSTLDIKKSNFNRNDAIYGGAIADYGSDMIISESTFLDNVIRGFRGGAIYVDGDSISSVNISGSEFNRNSAYYGGAIFENSGSSMNVWNSNFINNNAEGKGGAIYSMGNFNDFGSAFSSNNADNGGAIYLDGCNSAFEGSIFDNNFAYDFGGAIYALNSIININSNFTLNHVEKSTGGAMYIKNSKAYVKSNFDHNHANDYSSSNTGGAIGIADSNVTVCSNFTGNSAYYVGAAIHVQNSNLSVTESRFVNNLLYSPTSYGGAIYSVSCPIFTVENSYFEENLALAGGSLYVSADINDTSLVIRNSQFYKNRVPNNGAAIYAGGVSRFIVDNTVFDSNRAGNLGSGIFIFDVPEFEINQSSFNDNVAVSGGSVFLYSNSNLKIFKSNFTNNVAEGSGSGGAAIFLYKTSSLYIDNSNFTRNFAEKMAGAIYAEDETNVVNITGNSRFYNNTAEQFDYGVYANSGEISNTTFINTNVAGRIAIRDGCEFITLFLFKIDFIPSIFYGNAFNITIRELHNFNCTVNMTLNGTTSEIDLVKGIAIMTVGNLPLGTYNASLNFTNPDGSLLYYESNEFMVKYMSYIDLEDIISRAEPESVITLEYDYEFNPVYDFSIVEGIIINKKITINGNSHCLDMKGEARMFNIYGGANVTIENLNFRNAHYNSTDEGSAICVKSATLTVINSNFTNNSGKCGAVFASDDANLTVIGSSFTGNNASSGGAIYVKNSGLNVFDSSFAGNTATYGGAIYCLGSKERYVESCIFENNHANTAGAIYSGNVGAYADSCIFKLESDTCNKNVIKLNPTFKVDNFTSMYASDEKLTFNLTTRRGTAITNRIIEVEVYNNGTWYSNYSFLSGDVWIVDLPVGNYNATCRAVEFNMDVNILLGIFEKGFRSFSDLNSIINRKNSTEIYLDSNYIFDSLYDKSFVEGIVITRSVTIDGNGYTINANGEARIFNIYADNVTLKNILFVNGAAHGDGGAVYWKGVGGSVSYCSFVNNSVNDGRNNGGAIFWVGNNGSVSYCSFVNNSASYCGAIYWHGEGFISNSEFVGNHANRGGAIECWNSHVSVFNSTFVNNSAKTAGVILVSDCDGGIYSCSFINNSASLNGSAIYIQSSDYYVTGCLFMDNFDGDSVVFVRTKMTLNSTVNNNVFLNHKKGSEIYFVSHSYDSNGYYNWFGNFVNDYDELPRMKYCYVWLFLNATIDSVEVFSTSEIIFKLYAYDKFLREISEYDNSFLKPINLTVTSINGNIDKKIVNLGDTIKYTATKLGTDTLSVTVGNITYSFNVTVVKATTKISAPNVDATYNGNKNLVVTLTDSKNNPIRSAEIIINVNGAKKYTTDNNGQVKISIGSLVPKTYNVKISFAGNTNLIESHATTKVIVKKATPKMVAKKKTFKKSKMTKKYSITLKDSKKAIRNVKVTLKINGKKAIAAKTNKNGKATFNIKKLNRKGTFKATIKFNGDKYYKKVTKKVKIKIK